MIQVTFLTNSGKVASAPENSNLLRVSLREQGGIPFKCGGGICGTCKCRIEQGLEHTDAIKPKERKHLTEEQFRAGYRMACQTFLNGDVSVSWVPLAERRADAPRVELDGRDAQPLLEDLCGVPDDIPWAHLDIAGMSEADEDGPLAAEGPTGFGVRLLDRVLS